MISEAKKAYNRAYWHANKDRLRAYRKKYYEGANAYSRKRRREHKEKVFTLIEPLCAQCGFNDIRALHFHHLDPSTKEFEIMRVLSSNRKVDWTKVEEELEKCIVLCANCHLIEHAG